jgi:type IV secretory pathway VirB2 component (pilin)
MSKLIREPIRPYWLVLFTALVGILVETAAAIAQAQPWKSILDNVVSNHHLPKWLMDSVGPLPGGTRQIRLAAFAVVLLVAIAVAKAFAHRLGLTRRTDHFVEIKGAVVEEQGTYAEFDEARHETKAALAA